MSTKLLKEILMSSSPLGIYVTHKYNFLDEKWGDAPYKPIAEKFGVLEDKKEEKSVNSQVTHTPLDSTQLTTMYPYT